MWYVVLFLIGLVVGWISMFIYKKKLIDAGKDALERVIQ